MTKSPIQRELLDTEENQSNINVIESIKRRQDGFGMSSRISHLKNLIETESVYGCRVLIAENVTFEEYEELGEDGDLRM